MTPVCFRLDLDSTPWDRTSAYGVEQARLVALFDFARQTGVKFHVFASSRALRASPGLIDAVLSDGHDLDWLYQGSLNLLEAALVEAEDLVLGTGHSWWGVGLAVPWDRPLPERVRFISAPDVQGIWREPLQTLRFPVGSCTPTAVQGEVLTMLEDLRPVRTLRDWSASNQSQG